jgi:hypothetical protein
MYIFHGNPDQPVVLSIKPVDVCDVGVREPRGQLRLAQKALEQGVADAQPLVEHL